jgi:hypothetical protein
MERNGAHGIWIVSAGGEFAGGFDEAGNHVLIIARKRRGAVALQRLFGFEGLKRDGRARAEPKDTTDRILRGLRQLSVTSCGSAPLRHPDNKLSGPPKLISA